VSDAEPFTAKTAVREQTSFRMLVSVRGGVVNVRLNVRLPSTNLYLKKRENDHDNDA
jgi:hypothetical protein